MELFTQYKIIFFLFSILVITSIIGELSKIDREKEGFAKGIKNPLKGITKMLKAISDWFSGMGQIIFWLIKCSFMWVPLVIFWLLQYVLCIFYKIISIPNCFLWYALDIAGKIIYLPFRLTFFILDLILKRMKIDFRIQPWVNRLWWFLDDISHISYNNSGFHFIHFPKDVIQRCYKCKVGKFPKLPKFPMGALRKIGVKQK